MPRRLRVPHTMILLIGIMVLAWALTWILPAGAYQRDERAVVPNSFELLDEGARLPPWALLTAVPQAMADAQDVIFFVLLIGGAIAILRETEAIDAAIGSVLNRFREHVTLLIFVGMLLFTMFSASFGMAEEYIAFVGILIALCGALKLDTVSAVGIMVVGYCVGYGIAPFNPFTVIVAQDIAGLKPVSGAWFRAITAIPLFLLGFHHVWKYAVRVRQDPSKSLVAGIDSAQVPPVNGYPPMTIRHGIILLGMLATLVALICGIGLYEWYLTELTALFLAMALLAAIVGKLSLNRSATIFISGAAELTGTALLIGFARSIALLMEQGQILDTVVYGLATPLGQLSADFSAVGMLLIQSMLNFFIPSGSGQAFATMPIMAPLGDIVGVNRQVAVLAYQYGDGFTNMIVPTNAVLMGILGLAGIPYDRWFRFILPLILKLFAVSAVILIIAVHIGLH